MLVFKKNQLLEQKLHQEKQLQTIFAQWREVNKKRKLVTTLTQLQEEKTKLLGKITHHQNLLAKNLEDKEHLFKIKQDLYAIEQRHQNAQIKEQQTKQLEYERTLNEEKTRGAARAASVHPSSSLPSCGFHENQSTIRCQSNSAWRSRQRKTTQPRHTSFSFASDLGGQATPTMTISTLGTHHRRRHSMRLSESDSRCGRTHARMIAGRSSAAAEKKRLPYPERAGRHLRQADHQRATTMAGSLDCPTCVSVIRRNDVNTLLRRARPGSRR